MKKYFALLLGLIFILNFTPSISKDSKAKLKISYFHATMRCEGCMQIENFLKMSINELFENEIKNGKIELLSLDFMQPENEKLAEKYKIESQELICSVIKNNKEKKWVNLDKIWDKSSNYEEFKAYIKKEINKLLKQL